MPRHFQVRQILMDMVSAESWRPGDKIPAETELASALGVSKMTVNKAILALTAEGVFYREIGRGTFISLPAGVEASRAVVTDVAPDALVHVVIPDSPELVSDNEYLCALLLAMRCCTNPLETRILLRQIRGRDYASAWREGGAAGWLIVAPEEQDIAGLQALAVANARAVVIGASWPEVPLPAVDSDNVGGAALAVEHLASLGHTAIGMVYAAGHTSNTQDRLRGFQNAMQRMGRGARAQWVVDCGADYRLNERMRGRICELLRRPDRPTALLAGGPFLAQSVLDAAGECGISVPRDLSVVGFDDPTSLAEGSPRLTTVRQPLEEMGREAMLRLQAQIAGDDTSSPGTRRTLPCHLVVRESTSPLRDV